MTEPHLCSFATGPAASGHVLKAVEGSRRPWGKLFFGHCRFIHIWPLHPDPENVRCCCWNSSYQSHVAENQTWPRDAQSKMMKKLFQSWKCAHLQAWAQDCQASILITLLDLFPLNGLNGFMNLVQTGWNAFTQTTDQVRFSATCGGPFNHDCVHSARHLKYQNRLVHTGNVAWNDLQTASNQTVSNIKYFGV